MPVRQRYESTSSQLTDSAQPHASCANCRLNSGMHELLIRTVSGGLGSSKADCKRWTYLSAVDRRSRRRQSRSTAAAIFYLAEPATRRGRHEGPQRHTCKVCHRSLGPQRLITTCRRSTCTHAALQPCSWTCIPSCIPCARQTHCNLARQRLPSWCTQWTSKACAQKSSDNAFTPASRLSFAICTTNSA